MNNGPYPQNPSHGGPYGNQGGTPYGNGNQGSYGTPAGSGYTYGSGQSGNYGANPQGAGANTGAGAWNQGTGQSQYGQQGSQAYGAAGGYNTGGYGASSNYGPGGPGTPGGPGAPGGPGNGGGNKLVYIIAGTLVVLALIAGGVFFTMNSGSDSTDAADTSTSSTSTSESGTDSSTQGSSSSSTSSTSTTSSSTTTTKSTTFNAKSVVDKDGYVDMCSADTETNDFLGLRRSSKRTPAADIPNQQYYCILYPKESSVRAIEFLTLKDQPEESVDAKKASGLPDGWLFKTQDFDGKMINLYMREMKTGWIMFGTPDGASKISDFLESLEKVLDEVGTESA